jgi:hypothetical protein
MEPSTMPRACRLALVLAALTVTASCVATKQAQLGLAEAAQPVLVERISGEDSGPIEIRCGIGEVCAEVRISHVQRAADGAISVTIENQTEDHLAVQLALEGFDGHKRRTDRTGFHDVVLAPRGDSVLEVTTAAALSDTLVVHVRARHS